MSSASKRGKRGTVAKWTILARSPRRVVTTVSSVQGWREIGVTRQYYRSRWEANYARYLQWMKLRGDIHDWEYEPKTFWFENIRRGVRSYKPDFRVWTMRIDTHPSTWSEFHEVKGWMDPKSKTKLKRMAKYYPDVKIIVISKKQITEIGKKLGGIIAGWETAKNTSAPDDQGKRPLPLKP